MYVWKQLESDESDGRGHRTIAAENGWNWRTTPVLNLATGPEKTYPTTNFGERSDSREWRAASSMSISSIRYFFSIWLIIAAMLLGMSSIVLSGDSVCI